MKPTLRMSALCRSEFIRNLTIENLFVYQFGPHQHRRWKLNNGTSVIHYSLGVSFDYSLLVLLVIPIS